MRCSYYYSFEESVRVDSAGGRRVRSGAHSVIVADVVRPGTQAKQMGNCGGREEIEIGFGVRGYDAAQEWVRGCGGAWAVDPDDLWWCWREITVPECLYK